MPFLYIRYFRKREALASGVHPLDGGLNSRACYRILFNLLIWWGAYGRAPKGPWEWIQLG